MTLTRGWYAKCTEWCTKYAPPPNLASQNYTPLSSVPRVEGIKTLFFILWSAEMVPLTSCHNPFCLNRKEIQFFMHLGKVLKTPRGGWFWETCHNTHPNPPTKKENSLIPLTKNVKKHVYPPQKKSWKRVNSENIYIQHKWYIPPKFGTSCLHPTFPKKTKNWKLKLSWWFQEKDETVYPLLYSTCYLFLWWRFLVNLKTHLNWDSWLWHSW